MALTALNSSFYAYRLLYQKRCDEAMGMSYVTTKQRLLLTQYQTKEADEINRLKITAFHLGVIRAAKRRIRQIRRLVNEGTPLEEAQKLYLEAQVLQQRIDRSSEAINARTV